jgi:hypothetical protein
MAVNLDPSVLGVHGDLQFLEEFWKMMFLISETSATFCNFDH